MDELVVKGMMGSLGRLLKIRNRICYYLTKSFPLSSLIRNIILFFPSALGIEILCLLSSLIGESIGFYLFGFNPIGIIYAYSLGFLVAGFAIFLIIIGRYKEHNNINLSGECISIMFSCCSCYSQ